MLKARAAFFTHFPNFHQVWTKKAVNGWLLKDVFWAFYASSPIVWMHEQLGCLDLWRLFRRWRKQFFLASYLLRNDEYNFPVKKAMKICFNSPYVVPKKIWHLVCMTTSYQNIASAQLFLFYRTHEHLCLSSFREDEQQKKQELRTTKNIIKAPKTLNICWKNPRKKNPGERRNN